jgi:hypothetical protein
MGLDLPSIHEKALLASVLSLAACCLSSSVTSLGSVKLSVDSVGDGMADEAGVVEEGEVDDDSLMLTIQCCLSAARRFYLYTFSTGPAKHTHKNLFTTHKDRHVKRTSIVG